MGICEREAQPFQGFLVDSGANSLVWDESFTPNLQPTGNTSHSQYSCHCDGLQNNIQNLACLHCLYKSGVRVKTPLHPEVTRLRDPEDSSRYAMYEYHNRQLNIRDYGLLGATHCPVTVTSHFVRRSRRYRTTGVKR